MERIYAGRVSEAVAIIVGATISALVAVVVVAVQHAFHLRHERKQESAERLSALTAASHAVALRIGEIARAPSSVKQSLEDEVMTVLGDRFNSALAAVMLLEDDTIVRAAFALDRELVQLLVAARSDVWERDDWRSRRVALSHLVDDFQQHARRHLGASPLSGPPLWGQAGLASPVAGAELKARPQDETGLADDHQP